MLVNIYVYIYWLIYTLSVSWQLRTMQLFLFYCYYFIKNAYMTFKVQFCWIWSALRMSCPSKISGLLYILLFFFCHATEISWTFHAYVVLRYCKFSWGPELSIHASCYATVSSLELSTHAYCHATESFLELSTHMSCYATVSSLELSTHASCYATVRSLELSMRTSCYATLSSLELSTHASC